MADVHLGARKYGERAFYEDIFQAFEESVEEIVKDRVRALVIAGDLFDSPHPDNATLAFALRKLRELTSRGVKVIAARGEHDTPGRREPSPLDVLAEALEGFHAPQPPPGLKLTSAAELPEPGLLRLCLGPQLLGPGPDLRQLVIKLPEPLL